MKVIPLNEPEKILKRTREVIARDKLSLKALERAAGVNRGVLSQVLNGKPVGDKTKAKALDALGRWLNLDAAKQESAGAFDNDVFVDDLTNTMTITGVLSHCQTAADMACLYGGAGGGKTAAIGKYRADNSNVYVITGEPALCSLSAALRPIAAAVGAQATTCAGMSEEIAERLTGRNALLVIDEAHHFSQRIFDQLRCIYDKVNAESNDFGLVLLGNEPLFEALTNGRAMKQIYSRLGVCEMLQAPPETDGVALLSGILGGAKLTDAGMLFAAKQVRGIGGYRALIKACRRAVLRHRKPLRSLTEADVLSANENHQ